MAIIAFVLTWIFYATTVQVFWMISPVPFPTTPVSLLEPFRIANRYGLFAVMTRGRYEIEFQGSNDGKTWIAYPFRHKPQELDKVPRIYAPYQPRFDWNLWFASLGELARQSDCLAHRTQIALERPRRARALCSRPFSELTAALRSRGASGNTGSRPCRKKGNMVCGGGASFSGCTRQRLNSNQTAESASSNGHRSCLRTNS